MDIFLAELFGTLILILLGNGVVANALLSQSKGEKGGWIVITAGWGFAVAIAVYATGWVSGGHLNPAVTFGLVLVGKTLWHEVPFYLAGQMIGAMIGQGCLKPGYVKATYGTGCFLLMNIGKKMVLSKKHLLTTIAISINGVVEYALEGSIFIAGAAILWLRDNLKVIKKSSEIDALAASVPDTGGVYFVPAFTGLGAPHWDPQARGTILGISRSTTTAHIARAVLESIAFQAADILKAMQKDAKIGVSQLHVDGGVVVSDLLMQMQANLMKTPVMRPKNHELTALGAAFLAGLAIGIWKKPEDVLKTWELDKKFSPQKQDPKTIIQWNRAVERAKGWER